jgi:hypothetical protein
MLEGTIVEVMECWPLELKIKTNSGECSVGLTDDAVVLQEGASVACGVLVPGMSIRARMTSNAASGPGGLADRIEIDP